MNGSRAPAVAGSFYPGTERELRKAIDSAFRSSRGTGAPAPARGAAPRTLRALVVPHAGYQFSGPIAARGYAVLAEQPPPEAILILGVDHHGTGAPFAVSRVPWSTPLGSTSLATELVDRLSQEPIVVDERAHALEHSIEVQIPFLQTIDPSVPVAALSIRFAPLDRLRRVAARVREAVEGRPVVVIASTDFSHYVPAETARRLDGLAIDQILRRDGGGLYEVVRRNDISMCGIAPTTVLLEALAGDRLKARSLGWGHSGEAEPMSEVVGYAAVRFDGEGPDGAGDPSIRPST